MVLFLIIIFGSPHTSFAQESINLRRDSTVLNIRKTVLWVTLGYGVSSIVDASFASAIGAIVAVEHNSLLFNARVIYDKSGQENKFPHEELFDTGLLLGYGSHDSLWFWNTSIGIAYAHTVKKNYDHTDSSSVTPVDVYRANQASNIGIALQGQVFSKFSSTSRTGLGATICADINKGMSFFVLLLSLEIGIF
jgi:hypothetical protein